MPQDILLDENKNLKVENGDLVIGDATQQNIIAIVTGSQGEVRSSPVLGTNPKRFLKATSLTALEENVRRQLRLDGATIERVSVDPNDFAMRANWEKDFELNDLNLEPEVQKESRISNIYEYKVQSNQNLFDVALQELGGVKGVFAIADLNSLCITDILASGQVLEIDEADIVNRGVVNYFKSRGYFIKTGE